MAERIALIMAGGGGTRLWPASSKARPKQLIPGMPEPGSTLLGATVRRLEGLVSLDRIFVVTTREQVDGIRKVLPDLPADHVIAEPFGRNTAPCVALAAVHLSAHAGDSNPTLIVLPADHYVGDETGFRNHLSAACAHAEAADTVVTLGIEPDHPETGYGYMERTEEALEAVTGDGGLPVFAAKRFVEKPDAVTASQYVASGRFVWNAGIFVMPLKRAVRDFATHTPETWTSLARVGEALAQGIDPGPAASDAYGEIEPAPIDVAVMEKLTDIRVVPASVGWSDLGSWQSIAAIARRDKMGNAKVDGDGAATQILDSEGCLVWNEDASVGIIGVKDVAVVVSHGRVLVCPLDRAQEVRAIAKALEKKR